MFNIWQSVSELRQPCLSRPMQEAFLAPDGTVKPSLLKSLDQLLWEHTASDYLDWKPPSLRLISTNNAQKWLNISALQKAIRRGQVERAIQFAKQGCQLDADHVFRRLSVCALEDVGIGNLLAVACCLSVLGDKRRRKEMGESNLAGYLAQMLAESPKSRLACDLLSLVEYNPSLRPLISDWAIAPDAELASRLRDQSVFFEEKMLATWLLAGTHRFRSATLPKSNYRPRSTLMKEMAKERMPLILYYIADRGAARTNDALFCSYLQIWNMMEDQEEFALVENDIPVSEIIGSFPAEAYDMHTREGRVAISRFRAYLRREKVMPLRFEHHYDVGNMVFRMEGGLLAKEVLNKKFRAVSCSAARLEIAGKPKLEIGAMEMLNNHIPILQQIRRQIFTGS